MAAARAAADRAADAFAVKRVARTLEDRQEIARLLGEARDAPGCRIFIGSENRMFALSGSSVIAAPYRGSQGDVVGVVGVKLVVIVNHAINLVSAFAVKSTIGTTRA